MSRCPVLACASVLLVAAAGLSGCSEAPGPLVRDHYASLDDCAADWGGARHCERVLSSGYQGGKAIYRGPAYPQNEREAARRDAGGGAAADPARQGRVIGTVREPVAQDGGRTGRFDQPSAATDDAMEVTVLDALSGLPYFVAYFGVALLSLTLGLAVYVAIAARREVRLVVQGNVAAAAGMAGALVGFALPLTSALVRSETLLDALIWAGVALLAQVIVLGGIRLMLAALVRRVQDGQVASGVFLGAIAVVLGLLNAAAIAIA